MTREMIKQVALNMFSQKGYEGTALSEIAGQVGIKTPSIYRHFPSKEHLFLEIWQDLVADYRRFMNSLMKRAEITSIEGQILELIMACGTHFKEHPQQFTLWVRMQMFAPPEFKNRIFEDSLALERDILEYVGALLSQGMELGEVKSGKVEDLLAAFVVLKEGYVQWLMFYGLEQFEEYTRRIWPLLWSGMGNIRMSVG